MADKSCDSFLKEIEPQLFIGNLESFNLLKYSNPNGIKSVLSLGLFNCAPCQELDIKSIEIFDTELENILIHIETAIDFIKKSIEKGAILVHCSAGISRSAAFIAAYLMQRDRLSVNEALQRIYLKHPTAAPNDGFLRQLQLFEEMNYSIDVNHSGYQYLLLEIERQHVLNGATPTLKAKFDASHRIGSKTVKKVYTCRKCRNILFDEKHLIPHEVHFKGKDVSTSSQSLLRNVFRGKRDIIHTDKIRCMSIFIQPMEWMSVVDEKVLDGKIGCPKCAGKLGTFSWKGDQCSCGTWIAPSFMIHKDKVDLVERLV